MGAVLLALLKKNWLTVAIAAAIVVAQIWIIHASYSRGAADTKNEFRDALTNQLQERNDTDGQVEGLDLSGICRALGGELRDGRC